MISDNTIRKISEIFIGDSEENYYKYKSGPKIVEFFNEYFGFEDCPEGGACGPECSAGTSRKSDGVYGCGRTHSRFGGVHL